MGRALELIAGPIRSLRRATIVWAVSMAGLVGVTIAFWPTFQETSGLQDFIDQLPANLIQAFGLQDFASPAGYLRGNLYDFFVPLLLSGAAIGFVNSLTSGEEDAGRIEELLAQPVSRQSFFLGRVAAASFCLGLVGLALTVAQFASDAAFDLSIDAGRLVAAIALSGLIAAFHGGMALAIAGVRARPALVLGVPLFVAVAGCVVEALFPLSTALAPLAHLSPWDWAFSGDPLVNPTDAWRYIALGLPAVAMALFGTIAFTRRDIRAA
jgi:ABC-2 type transport system permease protein